MVARTRVRYHKETDDAAREAFLRGAQAVLEALDEWTRDRRYLIEEGKILEVLAHAKIKPRPPRKKKKRKKKK